MLLAIYLTIYKKIFNKENIRYLYKTLNCYVIQNVTRLSMKLVDGNVSISPDIDINSIKTNNHIKQYILLLLYSSFTIHPVDGSRNT